MAAKVYAEIENLNDNTDVANYVYKLTLSKNESGNLVILGDVKEEPIIISVVDLVEAIKAVGLETNNTYYKETTRSFL